MEITLQATNALKIRGKHSAVYINPQDKTSAYNAAILLGNPAKTSLKIKEDVVIINGPGEYEAGGIKMSGTRTGDMTVYSITVDGIEIVIGEREALEKLHHKLQEHNIALIYANSEGTVSFATSLATNALLFYGEKAQLAVDSLAKEETKEVAKYQVTAEKLPSETETILLKSD